MAAARRKLADDDRHDFEVGRRRPSVRSEVRLRSAAGGFSRPQRSKAQRAGTLLPIEHITAVLTAEIYDFMNEGREFDLKKYITNLRRLPNLPEDADA